MGANNKNAGQLPPQISQGLAEEGGVTNATGGSPAFEIDTVVYRLASLEKRLLELMERLDARAQPTEWLTPEETARLLGISVTETGRHYLTRLKELRGRGLLSIYTGKKKYLYSKDDVAKLVKEVKSGKVFM